MAEGLSVTDDAGLRPIKPIEDLKSLAGDVATKSPDVIMVDPAQDLMIDAAYQRDLSAKSLALVRRIVEAWDWTKFKPPIVCVADNPGSYFVLDGQHTSIAAATHPGVQNIPAILVEAKTLKDRARSFVGHNMDRVAVHALRIYHSQLAADVPEAVAIDDVCRASGATIPRSPVAANRYAVGETTAIETIRSLIKKHDTMIAAGVLKALISARRAPIKATDIRACMKLVSEGMALGEIAAGLKAINNEQAEAWAKEFSKSSGSTRIESMALAYKRATSGDFE